jgi:hypothetical protein
VAKHRGNRKHEPTKRGATQLRITVDRDSVAMGDDMEVHTRVLEVPGETTLGAFLAHLRPDVWVGGGTTTWVVRLGDRAGDWVAMLADGEMRVLRESDRTLASLGLTNIHFDYWAGAPAELLLESLTAGRLPDKTDLQHEGWRRMWQDEDDRAQVAATTDSERLLSPEAQAAVAELGGRIEVHAPSYCRLAGADGERYVVRTERFWSSIGLIEDGGDQKPMASFRPPGPALMETTLVARLGMTWREARGLPPIDPPPHDLDIGRKAGIWMWSWQENDLPHEGRYSRDGSLAAVFAPYARLGVPEITALFAAGGDR